MNIDQVHRNSDCPVTANMVEHSFQVWDNHGGKWWVQGHPREFHPTQNGELKYSVVS